MANYPPPPQYGAPYNANGFMARAPGAPNNGAFQYAYQAPSQGLYMNGHTSVSTAPQVNTHSFQNNAQGAAAFASSVVNRNSPGYASQAYSHTGSHTYSLAQQIPPSTHVHAHSRSPTENLIPPTFADGARAQAEETKDVVVDDSDLEDGEVDDQEIEEPVNASGNKEMGSSFSRPSLQNSKSGAGAVSDDVNSSSMSEVPSQYFKDSLSVRGTNHSTSQPQDSQSRPIEKSKKHKSDANVMFDVEHGQHNLDTVDLATRKREEAKQALLDLHSYGFNFGQIVSQGMNPEALRSLYAEVGIALTEAPTEQQSVSKSPSQDVQADTKDQTSININPPTNITLEPYNNGTSSQDPKSTAASRNAKEELAAQAKTSTIANKVSNAAVIKKSPNTLASDTKPMDRKDYIARMLAAKAGKTATLPIPSVTSKGTNAATPETTSQQPSKSATTSESTSAATKPPPQVPEPSQKKDEADAEAKRKAQTDLARQKMEALKLQQENRTETKVLVPTQVPTSSTSEENPIRDGAGKLASVIDTAPQPPAPSRQNSYFSPISQAAPFSIPGLFPTAHSSTPSQSHFPSTSQSCVVSAQLQDAPTPPATSRQGPPAATTEGVSSVKYSNITGPETSTTPATASRKRQKAADFLDSPPKMKRPLGQQENSSIIIDISDEEMGDVSDDESAEGKSMALPNTSAKSPNINDPGVNRQKSIKDLPPLSDFSIRRRPPAATPPTAPNPTQAKEPKGLKTKEMEIELMNRKIAELEQRMNAKKTVSRADTPSTSGHTKVTAINEDVSEENKAISQVASVPHEKSEITAQETVAEGTALSAAEESENAATEQILREVEQAKAEVERSLAADIAQASIEQQILQPPIPSDTAENPRSVSSGEQQSSQSADQMPLEGQKKTSAESDQSRQLIAEDIGRLEDDELPIEHQGQVEMQENGQTFLQAEIQSETSREQSRARRIAIESGLPVLDASLERTRNRLECLRKEIMNLEMEVQKGVQGREALIEELSTLSRYSEDPHANELADIGSTGLHKPFQTQDEQGTIPSSPEVSFMDDSRSPQAQSTGAKGAMYDQAAQDQNIHQTSASPSPAVYKQLSDGELEEDVMDISRSDVDDGELSDPSYKSLNGEALQNTNLIDDEQNYEPPATVTILESPEDTEMKSVERPATADDKITANVDDHVDSKQSLDRDPNTNLGDRERLLSESPLVDDSSDLDEYEPPEPALSSPRKAVPHLASMTPPFPSLSSHNVDSIAPAQSSSAHNVAAKSGVAKTLGLGPPEVTRSESIQHSQYFTPYQSPLKQFKSFRNHPEYLNEVTQGFRSLTYSNTINPEIPICRYEIDGKCNDASCQSQHFKSLGLPDQQILADLGDIPKESDASAYRNGLKELIQDIRSRNVKDVNKVASEITAYRRRFLGESKILSL